MAFDRGERTYYVSDERLRAFRALPVEEKLRWVEELAAFIRLTRAAEDRDAVEPASATRPTGSRP